MKRVFLVVFSLVLGLYVASSWCAEPRWWKGNTHSHSWWSDGDAPPEVVAAWYRDHGYNFLVISDHNILARGDKWFAVKNENHQKSLQIYREKFGDPWVKTRLDENQLLVKLRTLKEFAPKFNAPNRFLLVDGEEITDNFEKLPVHLNSLNVLNLIVPQRGKSVMDTIQNNVDAVLKQREETGRSMLVHINHPNFGWGLTAEDIIPIKNAKFFEVYNGHPGVRNYGDETHIGTERQWDRILAERLGRLNYGVLYGFAVDDAHNYVNWGVGNANPGRGWIMVYAEQLSANSLISAMVRGDYYCSTGVLLKDVHRKGKELSLQVEAHPGIEYTIAFIGTKKNSDRIGEIFREEKGTSASYRLQGDELYVRAKITSNQPHPNPFAEGDVQVAWTQPLVGE